MLHLCITSYTPTPTHTGTHIVVSGIRVHLRHQTLGCVHEPLLPFLALVLSLQRRVHGLAHV